MFDIFKKNTMPEEKKDAVLNIRVPKRVKDYYIRKARKTSRSLSEVILDIINIKP